MLREGEKRVFDMGKVSGSFQDDIPTGAGDIEQNSQKAVSTARKHQADSLILYIPPPSGRGYNYLETRLFANIFEIFFREN